MKSKYSTSPLTTVLSLPSAETVVENCSFGPPDRGVVVGVSGDALEIRCSNGRLVNCDVLLAGGAPDLEPDDLVLFLPPVGQGEAGVVLGQLGKAGQPAKLARSLALRASEALSLKCGEASIELHADGKVLIKGDDVTVRAKGTKRIRAGSVSIN